MTYTPFYEGNEVVSAVGDPTPGTLISIASKDAAWVKWATGGLDLVDLRDIELAPPAPAPIKVAASVRTVFASNGGHGVVDFLSATGALQDWPQIAEGALNYVIGKLRASASMDLPYEQLDDAQREVVLHTAALRLLRDAVTPEAE